MQNWRQRIYPADQMERYLILDVILIVFLFYNVFRVELRFGVGGTLLLLGVFLVSFYIMLWFRDWRQLLASWLGCAVLAVLSMFYQESLLLNGIMIADLLGRIRARWQMILGMVGIVLMFVVTYFYHYDDPLTFTSSIHVPVLVIMLLITIIMRFRHQSKELKVDLALAQDQLEKFIQEEERQRIARDLHDTLGQTLTMMKLKSELAIRLVDKNPERAKLEMNEVVKTSRFALKQVRELVSSMKYVALAAEIEQAFEWLQTGGVHLEVKEEAPAPQLSKMAETMLALSIREAFTNLLKHSQATRCILTKQQEDGWFVIRIEDNGIGLAQTGAKEERGNGLESMKERMHLLGGRALIAEGTNGGVLITLQIPIAPEE